jgi:MSHA biogenesis protein MshQ
MKFIIKVVFLCAFLLSLNAEVLATAYSIPASMGSGIFSGCTLVAGTTSYNCTSGITLGSNDTLTSTTSAYILNITGSFTVNSNSSIGSSTYDVNIIVSSNITINSNVTVYGSLTANNGTLTLSNSASTTIYGNVSAATISMGNNATVTGNCADTSCTGSCSGTLPETDNCSTTGTKPVVSTGAASSITSGSVTLNGTVASNQTSANVSFNYGTTTSYGSTVTAAQSPLSASAIGTAMTANLSGLACGTTYHYRITATNTAGTRNGSDMTFQTSSCSLACTQPSNTPAGLTLTCQCDSFMRATLNPSTIFNSNWTVSTSDTTGILPSIVNSGYLRLTNNTADNAKAVSVPGIFPATDNYISVEFLHYAYNGSGADGIAVILSDYAIPAVPGAFGGSLGYAQKSNPGSDCTTTGGCPGFTGGWLGVALDEYGNYQNPTEGRSGGSGFIRQSVGMRGSGSGMNGYKYLAGTASLSPQVDNSGSSTHAPGYYYQVIVDARNEPTSTSVTVNRDTTGTGNSYTSLINLPNVYTAATAHGFTQAAVPNNWQISFTGSTGASNNIHEIGGLRICASIFVPPSGGVAGSFNAIDSAYGALPVAAPNYLTGHIYTKLVGTPFNLNVAALSNSQILTTYAITGTKTVTVKLVDNSDSLSNAGLDCSLSCSSSCKSKPAVTSQQITFANGAGDKGQKQSPGFTINSAYQKLVAIISDGTSSACSTDSFSVRPLSISSVTSSNATQTSTTGTPILKAGTDNFSLTATTAGVSNSPSLYTGVMKINSALLAAASPATNVGTLTGTFPSATSGTPSSTATATTFTYSEVGGFMFPVDSVYEGVVSTVDCPGMTTTQCDAVRATTWTGVDSIGSKGDCIQDSFLNTTTSGKYGCNFGLANASSTIGRFVPDHFDTVITLTSGVPMNCPTGLTCPTPYNGFVYSGEPFSTNIYARNSTGISTLNYDATMGLSKQVTLSAWSTSGGSVPIANGTVQIGSATPAVVSASSFNSGTTLFGTPATPAFTFAASPTLPTDIYLRAVDADNATSLRSPASASIEGGIKIVSGRVKVSNAYGSDLLPLSMTATAQFYNAGSWSTSTTDSLTNLTLTSPISIGVGTTTVTLTPSTGLTNGVLNISLSKPGVSGSKLITPGAPGYLPVISGLATFGIYKGNNYLIYMRENY